MIGITGVVVIGTWIGLAWPVLPAVALAMAWIFAGVAWCFRSNPRSVLPLGMAVLALACAHASMTIRSPAPRALGAQMARPQEQLVLRGHLVDDPVLESTASGRPRWSMRLRLEGVNRVGYWVRAKGLVDVQWFPASEAAPVVPAYGQQWEFSGLVRQRTEDRWTWAFLPSYRIRASEGQLLSSDGSRGNVIKRWSYAARRGASRRLLIGLEAYPEVSGILQALLLGYRHELPEDQHRLFAWTGTLHVFAISGLHVGIVGGLLILLIRSCGVSRRYWIWWLAPMLILYTISTGLRPSALRACTMALTFGSAYWFNRRPDAPSAWALAGVLVLAGNPTQLTAPGFIFSFVIVAGLIRLAPLFDRPFREWSRPDPYRRDVDRSSSPARILLRWALGLVGASVAAWLASMPLTAQYFNLFSPVALLGNLIVIPAAFVIVLTGALSLLVGGVSTVGVEVFNHANRWFVTGLIMVIDTLAEIPGAYRYVRSPGMFWVGCWYTVLFAGCSVRRVRARVKVYGVLCAVVGVVGVWQWWHAPDVVVSVLDAGDGHAVLVRTREGHSLYDAGPAWRSEALIRALRAEGVNRLQRVILSQATTPHVGAAQAVLNALPVGAVWHTGFAARSPAYREALAVARERAMDVKQVAAGFTDEWGAQVFVEVLHPAEVDRYRRADDAAMILRVSCGTGSVLLTGGASGTITSGLSGQGVDPAAAVLVVGHQGRASTPSPVFLADVAPEHVVLSVGLFNRTGFPDRHDEQILQQAGVNVWRTDAHGRVAIHMRTSSGRQRQRDALTVRAAR